MKKTVLRLLLILFIVPGCKDDKPLTNMDAISNDFWSSNKSSADSVLLITSYKVAKNYIGYLASLKKKPYPINENIKEAIERVDDKTIFFNKLPKGSKDYESLLKKNMVTFSNPTVADNSANGYIYFFRSANANDFTFKKVSGVDFETALQKTTALRNPITAKDEDAVFNETIENFWKQP